MAPDASRLGTLTPREQEIAAAAATGAPIAELAAALVVSPRTVETHLVRIYRKLGLRSRAELVALMLGQERHASGSDREAEDELGPAPSGAGTVRSSNLPQSASSFVGRQAEVEEVCRLVREHRLVTVLGVGGAGKTRLALQVAEELFDGSGEGVWLVELGTLTDADAVPAAVATALGIAQQPGADVLRSLVLVLAELHLLVVLDNCEHLVGACAQLADVVLRSCLRVHILATSREALVVDGERLYRIPPLSLPAPDAEGVAGLAGSEAALLFAERGAAQVTDFAVTDDDAALVGNICRRLDGLPLAIELAAARLRSMSPAEVHSRLDRRFALLTGGSRTAVPRQQTLAAAVDWSYLLLSAAEQGVLRRLSVFAAGFDLEAAESVVAAPDAVAFEIVDVLRSLVDKSLVVADTSGGAVRYRLLETIRDYAAGLASADSVDVQRMRAVHADYYVRLADRAAAELRGPDQVVWFARLDDDYPNVRAAIEHLLSAQEGVGQVLRLFGLLRAYWRATWLHAADGLVLVDRALALAGPNAAPQQLAAALLCRAYALFDTWDLAAQAASGRRAVELARQAGDRAVEAEALGVVCYNAELRGFPEEALAEGQAAVAMARETGARALLALTLHGCARSVWACEGAAAGEAIYREALAAAAACGDGATRAWLLSDFADMLLADDRAQEAREQLQIALAMDRMPYLVILKFARGNLGWAQLELGQLAAAEANFRVVLRWARRDGYPSLVEVSVLQLACSATAQGDVERAALLHGGADALSVGAPLQPTERKHCDRSVARLRQDLGARFDQLYETGRALSRGEIVQMALTHDGVSSPG